MNFFTLVLLFYSNIRHVHPLKITLNDFIKPWYLKNPKQNVNSICTNLVPLQGCSYLNGKGVFVMPLKHCVGPSFAAERSTVCYFESKLF